MVLQRAPFTRTRLDEERAKDRDEVITLKLNAEERAALEADKELLDAPGDGPVIKLLVEIGRKVLRETLTEERLRWLVSQKRVRYDGRKSRRRGLFRAESNTPDTLIGNTSESPGGEGAAKEPDP